MKADDPRVAVGSVVQIDPNHDPMFGGHFLSVTEIKSFGVQGYCAAFGNGEEKSGLAYYRVAWESIEYIGRAAWFADCGEEAK